MNDADDDHEPHFHVCPSCFHIWMHSTHEARLLGTQAAHTCPACLRGQAFARRESMSSAIALRAELKREMLESLADESAKQIELQSLVFRLVTRARIRRASSDRKSVQQGRPDRLADLLEEAALEIISQRARSRAQ